MKKIITYLVVCLLSLCLVSPAFGFWKEKITRNQVSVIKYVTKLQEGAEPQMVERPGLRRDNNYKVKQSVKELRAIMDEAEELAKAGKHEQIKDPVFSIRGMSDEGAEGMVDVVPEIKE
jgi:hypothetical protein